MTELRQKLQSKLSALPTKPSIASLIDQLLFANSSNILPQVPNDRTAAGLMHAQLELPLSEFAKGRLVKAWHNHQEQYLHHIPSNWTASRWTQTLITKIGESASKCGYTKMKLTTPTNKPKIPSRKSNKSIKKSVDNGHSASLNNADKIHFKDKTLAQLLRKTRHYEQTWLQKVQSSWQSKHESEESSTDTSVSAS